ncbi:MAG: PAS domain S-box protein [Terracidiphilus sp.]|nr:PAS domain S-box protein [Terracidiphilus sp.]MDR3798842.1 PAS domain S-box protein [Terracidiphilus sp.]
MKEKMLGFDDEGLALAGLQQPCDPTTAQLRTELSNAQTALRENREKFQAVFDGVETGILIIDPETHQIVDANPVALQLVGTPRDKIIGTVCHKFVCPAERGRCPVTDLGQMVDNSERVLLTVPGERLSIIKTVKPVEIEGHRYLLESFLDITPRKRSEKALEERTAYLNTVVETSPLGIVVLDKEERIQLSNTAFQQLFQYSREEAQGCRFNDLSIVPASLAADADYFTRECLLGKSVHFTSRRRRRDGALIDVEVYGVPLVIAGRPEGVLALYQDVSVRIRIEAEMAERHRLATLVADVSQALTGAESLGQGLQNCADALVRNTDVVFTQLWVMNDRQHRLEMLASSDMQLDGGRDRKRIDLERLERIAETGAAEVDRGVEHDASPDDADGQPKVAFAGYPLKVRNQVLGVAAVYATESLTDTALQSFESVVHSIAQFVESKRAEESLRESEDRFRTAFEAAPYGMCMTGTEGRFLHANAALCRMLGYSSEELLAGMWQQVTYPDDLERSRQVSAQFGRSDVNTVEIEKRYVHKQGSIIWARVKISVVKNSLGAASHYITQIEDITLRKQAEQALESSEERYRDLFENASDLVYTFDLDLRITSLNRLAEQTVGYAREEAMRLTLRQLVDAEHWDRIGQVVGRLVAGRPPEKFEVEIKAKNGRRVMLEINPRLIYRDGKAVEIQAIARDITGRDAAEVELRQTQKLESVGRLAAGIAHEINTPMQFVGDNVRFLENAFAELQAFLGKLRSLCNPASGIAPLPALCAEFRRLETEADAAGMMQEIPEAIAQTLEGIDRVVTIVQAMKEFAHPEVKGMAHADVNKALLNTLTVARNELKYVAEVQTDFGELPLVVCSISDMNQVFLNLLVNAAHAIGDVVKGTSQKGTIRIETRVEGPMALITIADTGAGIPDNIRGRIFDPFFTTKEVGRGTGQGLAIARTVVDRHKGSLTFESKVGNGTTFRICLPIDGAEPKARP